MGPRWALGGLSVGTSGGCLLLAETVFGIIRHPTLTSCLLVAPLLSKPRFVNKTISAGFHLDFFCMFPSLLVPDVRLSGWSKC